MDVFNLFLLTFISLLLGGGLTSVGWLFIGPGAHWVNISMTLRALLVHIVIVVVILLIIVVVKHLASHKWHWPLHEYLLILGCGWKSDGLSCPRWRPNIIHCAWGCSTRCSQRVLCPNRILYISPCLSTEETSLCGEWRGYPGLCWRSLILGGALYGEFGFNIRLAVALAHAHCFRRHCIAHFCWTLVLCAEAALACCRCHLGVPTLSGNKSCALVRVVHSCFCRLVTWTTRQVLVLLCLGRYLWSRSDCSRIEHLSLGQLTTLHLLQLLQVLARVNLWASCLVMIQILSIGDRISSRTCNRRFNLASNLTRLVLWHSSFHEISCYSHRSLLRLGSEGRSLTRYCSLPNSGSSYLLLSVKLVGASSLTWVAFGGVRLATLSPLIQTVVLRRHTICIGWLCF